MKTDETLTIERMLATYDPDTIAGCKVNKMRKRFLGYECPVTTGTIKDGLVDVVRVDEVLVNGSKSYICSPGFHKDWYKKNNPGILQNIGSRESYNSPVTNGCIRGFKDIDELPEYCDCDTCTARSFINRFDNEILITAYEIKVTKSDFHSKHGHNFCGNANFYVMPKELYQELKSDIPEDIGIIVHEVTPKINRLRKVRDSKFNFLTDCDIKWMILNVLKKQQSFYDPPPYRGEDYDIWK